MSRRQALALGAGAASAWAARPARAARRQPVVVELFTSQGCSSCPPADAFLTELRTVTGVVGLTYHVDYWDYLGWKNTLGSAEFSQRQYDYAKARGDMDVYTPQMIIDGGSHFVGSKRDVVMNVVERALAAPAGVPVSLTGKAMEFVVEIGAGPATGESTLWLIPIVPEISVKILKGEMAGREITYHNVVRELMPAAMWSGEAKTLSLPKDGVLSAGCTGCVAVLQRGKVGPVLGAATWGEVSA